MNLYERRLRVKPAMTIAIIFGFLCSCGEPLLENGVNTATPVVECHLYEGSNCLSVSVFSIEQYFKDDIKVSHPISQLNVNINNIALPETSSGTYSLDLDEDIIREGQVYNLKFVYNGKSIEATTTIPSPIQSLAIVPQHIELTSLYYWNMTDTTQVVVSWDDPDNSFYQIYIDSPNNPDMPSIGLFRRRLMQPFKGNTYRISAREFRSFGTHTIYVYRVCQDYAEMYERISASDLANPVSYIQNAFGIFTSLSVAHINFSVNQKSN